MEHGAYQTRWDGYQNDEWEWSDDSNKWSEKDDSCDCNDR